jgi:hypothetical protein
VANWREKGWPEDSPLFQPPNPPLWVAQGAWLVAAVTHGPARTCARIVSLAGIAVWAWLELADGVNWVRRLYGAVGLAYVGGRIGTALGHQRAAGSPEEG